VSERGTTMGVWGKKFAEAAWLAAVAVLAAGALMASARGALAQEDKGGQQKTEERAAEKDAKKQERKTMGRVRGIGGIFFKSKSPEALRVWYAKHLGIVSEGEQGAVFAWNQPDSPAKDNVTAWSIFPASTKYFGAGTANFMMNYVVDDLHATLKALRDEGVPVDEKIEEAEYGKFGWITDPDGNRIELWEPLPKK
jgi:catechol 2,3-dioxygenase-like lactoylglutathione lyase family enzyme